MAEKLQTAGFTGTIQLTSHLGQFCLKSKDTGELILPSEDDLLSSCTISNLNAQQADIAGLEESIGFNHFTAAFDLQYGERLTLAIKTAGLNIPSTTYPEKNTESSAFAWNAIAQQNQRVEIELRPHQ